MKQLAVAIGGVTIAMVSSEGDIDLALRGPHARFAASDTQPDITVQVSWEGSDQYVVSGFPPSPGLRRVSPKLASKERATADSRTVTAERLFDSGGVWQLYREGDLLSFDLRSPKFGSVPYVRATFNPDFTSGVVYLRRDCFDTSAPLYPLEYPLDELLVTNWLALGRGVEVHACGIVDRDGTGYLCAGFSGAGKTTTARLWREEKGARVLSDDRIILRKMGADVWMHGTPWHGDEPLASPERAILKRGFFLQHGQKNQLTPVAGAQSVMELFARSFPPFFSPRAIEFTLSLLTDVTQAVPFFNLGFVPDRHLPAFLRTT